MGTLKLPTPKKLSLSLSNDVDTNNAAAASLVFIPDIVNNKEDNGAWAADDVDLLNFDADDNTSNEHESSALAAASSEYVAVGAKDSRNADETVNDANLVANEDEFPLLSTNTTSMVADSVHNDGVSVHNEKNRNTQLDDDECTVMNAADVNASILWTAGDATDRGREGSALPNSTEIIATAEEQTMDDAAIHSQSSAAQDVDSAESHSLTEEHVTTGSIQEPPSTPAPTMHGVVDDAASRTRLVVLVSSHSINRQVSVRQDLVETALSAAGVEFESLDGALEHHKELRNELFLVSGLRGEYPQFFLVNIDHGGTTFWGGWEQFQHANDDGKLNDIFGQSASIPQTPGTPSVFGPQPHIPDFVPSSEASSALRNDVLLENFSHQIKRIEENYQMERMESERKHAMLIQEVSSNAARVKQELDDRLSAEITEKDNQIQELCRRNEGYRLKMDVLKREVTGTQKLLQARDGDVGKANQKYFTDLRAMEKQLVAAEAKANSARETNKELQKAVEASNADRVVSQREHDELKNRAKAVASELKEKRLEGRQLQSQVAELTGLNRSLQETADSLQERLNHEGMSQTEKDQEMVQLQVKLEKSDEDLKRTEQVWRVAVAKSEQALTDYKKKAQNSLSMANSRIASAVQAREEAELDTRAARSTADSAFDKATQAEIASREAVAAAKATVTESEKQRNAAIVDLEKVKADLLANNATLKSTQEKLKCVLVANERNSNDLVRTRSELEAEQSTVASCKRKLLELSKEADVLRRDVASLRGQLQQANAAADVASKNNEPRSELAQNLMSNGETVDSSVEALRQELREANQAIEDLKAALTNAIDINKPENNDMEDSERTAVPTRNHSANESIPLFYAMEKQAEVNTLRTEINRLASLHADAQSSATEAKEGMEEMRRHKEDAEARLKRFEKLVPSATHNGDVQQTSDSGAINIEYLKHIMLRFLNARAVTERKALVPVIGAVLELTPTELQAAVENVEHNSGSVSSSIFGFLA